MPLPPPLSQAITTALDEVRLHPQHQLAPHTRRRIYAAFGPADSPVAQRARGWAAVITARRVLPIFEQAFPHEPLPRRLINLAERVLLGSLRADSWRVEAYCELSYNASGNAWGYDEEDMPWEADMAGYAARKALLEVLGYEPLKDLGSYFIVGYMPADMSSSGELYSDDKMRSGEQFSEAQLASIEAGDTVSAAVVAFAHKEDGSGLSLHQFRVFWEWWLQEAVATAWEHASQ